MKGRSYGECIAAEKYLPRLTVHRSGLDSFVMRDNPAPADIQLARQGFKLAKKVVASGKYDMVILDEINIATHYTLLSVPEVLEIIDCRAPGVELILTGRYADERILERADLVTEMLERRHYYQQGVQARTGIEK